MLATRKYFFGSVFTLICEKDHHLAELLQVIFCSVSLALCPWAVRVYRTTYKLLQMLHSTKGRTAGVTLESFVGGCSMLFNIVQACLSILIGKWDHHDVLLSCPGCGCGVFLWQYPPVGYGKHAEKSCKQIMRAVAV